MSDEEFFKQEFENCGEIQPLIDELEDNCPDGRTKAYGLWEKKMEFLIKKYNMLAAFKAYREKSSKESDAGDIPGNMEGTPPQV